MSKQTVSERLHDQMHALPGVPEHGEAERLNHRGGRPVRPFQNRPLKGAQIDHGREHREPRVLVGWQNAIARLFSRRSK